MMRVLELRFGQTFVIVDCAVPDELYLWHPRDGLEVWMKNRLLRLAGLVVAMAIRFGGGVERLVAAGQESRLGAAWVSNAYLGEFILLFWGDYDISEQESTMLATRE